MLRKIILSSSLTALSLCICSAYEHRVPIAPSDSKQEILKKAASLTPNKPQLLHHQDEFNAFIHFGPNTFSGVEWGSGKEDPAMFNPTNVDTDQWCRILKAAGARKVVITVKHHDGYCTFQTRYNKEFSVRQSAWKDGEGDVLKELSQSCEKYGLKLGIYLSPADLYQIESAEGLYGNLSKYQESIIPTDPASFKSDPLTARKTAQDFPTFRVKADDYNRYFMNQLYELLTEYGPIHEVWFDGAHPKRKGGQEYIREEWFAMIRKLAPEAAIFGGPDVRWCGNERGDTRDTEWNVLPVESFAVSGYDRPDDDIGSDEHLFAKDYSVYGEKFQSNFLYYLVSEVDVSIRHGWFWRDETAQTVFDADHVFDMYERSVGGNSVFLLNVPPNREGRIAARDEASLLETGRRIQATYGTDLAEGATSDASGLFDRELTTFWQAPTETSSFIVTLPKVKKINRIALQENIQTVGQRVRAHAVDAWADGAWSQIAEATTIGYKRILRFDAVNSDRFRVRILGARDLPTIATFSAHYYQSPPPAVTMRRNADGLIALESKDKTDAETRIHYTLDGSEPTNSSPVYDKAIELPNGGIVKARSNVDGLLGLPASMHYGISKKNWKIVSVSSEQSGQWGAAKAIDDDPQTFWHTSWNTNQPHPHNLVIDLGKKVSIAGITYLPRQDKLIPDSMVESGSIDLSNDGKTWHHAGDFTFGNLLNDPTQRTHRLKNPGTARYIRFTSKAGVQDKPYAGAAEIGVISQ